MKKKIWISLIIASLLSVITLGASLYFWAIELPYELYRDYMQGKYSNEWYQLPKSGEGFLTPRPPFELEKYVEDYGELWKEFHLQDMLVPLPKRHPLFNVVPDLKLSKDKKQVFIGLKFLSPSKRIASQLYFLENRIFSTYEKDQKIFTIPICKSVIESYSDEDIWRDVFGKNISLDERDFKKMIYNLFLVNLRMKFLPAQLISYQYIPSLDIAVLEIPSKNKDYKSEIILKKMQNFIFSYLVITEKSNQDSVRLRAKFIESIKFQQSDESISHLIYQEFKQLSFARQVDQEGMLYLLSAWSHNVHSADILKEMIYFLERGQSNSDQLKLLYKFSYFKFGQTFANNDDVEIDDPEINLHKKMELEEKRNIKEAEEMKANYKAPVVEMNPEEKMNDLLKKAKEERLKKKSK
jgi:hypothetical protein